MSNQPNTMTAEQKLKHLILNKQAEWAKETPPEITADNVDAVYQEAYDNDGGSLQDARNDVRASGDDTGLKCEWSRHYESKAVACQYLDGSWIGWTYWYGGGKHGEPEGIDWMDEAYDLTVTEEPRTIIHRTFTKVEATNEAV
ncbi:MAG TPA: hypothetical protein VF534_01690 [Paraburkholderia sp.]